MGNWAHVGFGSECDACGGSEDVLRYRHKETGEERCLCDPCEQVAGTP